MSSKTASASGSGAREARCESYHALSYVEGERDRIGLERAKRSVRRIAGTLVPARRSGPIELRPARSVSNPRRHKAGITSTSAHFVCLLQLSKLLGGGFYIIGVLSRVR